MSRAGYLPRGSFSYLRGLSLSCFYLKSDKTDVFNEHGGDRKFLGEGDGH